jgi:hypothetical protein
MNGPAAYATGPKSNLLLGTTGSGPEQFVSEPLSLTPEDRNGHRRGALQDDVHNLTVTNAPTLSRKTANIGFGWLSRTQTGSSLLVCALPMHIWPIRSTMQATTLHHRPTAPKSPRKRLTRCTPSK